MEAHDALDPKVPESFVYTGVKTPLPTFHWRLPNVYSIELKVKRLSLQAEARIIRRLMKKHPRRAYALQSHLTSTVRRAARYAHVANAFIRGRRYASAECFRRETTPDIDPGILAKEIRAFAPTLLPRPERVAPEGKPVFYKDDEAHVTIRAWLYEN